MSRQQVEQHTITPDKKMGIANTQAAFEDAKDEAKRTAKDSVFCNLFKDKKYILQLYQALHPEETGLTEDDITDVTLTNVLIKSDV